MQEIQFVKKYSGAISDQVHWSMTVSAKEDFFSKQLKLLFMLGVIVISLIDITPASARENLLLESDFETGKIEDWSLQNGNIPGSIEVQSETKRAGEYAVRLHMKRCSFLPPYCSPRAVGINRPRAQLGGGRHRLFINISLWMGYSVFIPKDWVFTLEGAFPEVVGVIAHSEKGSGGPGDGCTKGGGQPFSFRIDGNKWIMRSTTDSNDRHYREFALGPVTKGEWMDVVMNWKWSYRDDGFYKIWINGRQIIDFSGNTICVGKGRNTSGEIKTLPYPNATIYKANWEREPDTKNISQRTIYVDEIRFGGPSSSYKDVSPDPVDAAADNESKKQLLVE